MIFHIVLDEVKLQFMIVVFLEDLKYLKSNHSR